MEFGPDIPCAPDATPDCVSVTYSTDAAAAQLQTIATNETLPSHKMEEDNSVSDLLTSRSDPLLHENMIIGPDIPCPPDATPDCVSVTYSIDKAAAQLETIATDETFPSLKMEEDTSDSDLLTGQSDIHYLVLFTPIGYVRSRSNHFAIKSWLEHPKMFGEKSVHGLFTKAEDVRFIAVVIAPLKRVIMQLGYHRWDAWVKSCPPSKKDRLASVFMAHPDYCAWSLARLNEEGFVEIELPPPPHPPLLYYLRNDWHCDPEGCAYDPPERLDYDPELWLCENVEDTFARYGYRDTMADIKQEVVENQVTVRCSP